MSTVLIDAHLGRQAVHGRPGFAPYAVTIASAELPCGASWLASCLLELGVALWRPWGIADHDSWQPLPDGRFRYRFPGSGWSRLVPGLVDGREFSLRRTPVPRFSHCWPGQLPATSKVILYVRDPRDALRSEWQRRRRGGALPDACGLAEFAAAATPAAVLSARRAYGAWLLAWRAAARDVDTLVLRFEDAKLSPAATLRRVLDFIGIEASGAAQARALQASTHGAVVAAERALLRDGIVPTALLGDGRPFAHRSAPATEQVLLDGALAQACQWLGYPPPADVVRSEPVDLEALHAALATEGCAEPETLRRCLTAALSA